MAIGVYSIRANTDGTKYLRCDTEGTYCFPSKTAYGEWNSTLYKGADANVLDWIFIAKTSDIATSAKQNGYLVRFGSDEKIYLYKTTAGTLSSALITSGVYSNAVSYQVKVTRTTAGLFTLWVNGVSIGTTTDTSFTTCSYSTVDADALDRIANIKIYNQV